MSINRWIDKEDVIHTHMWIYTMEYYSAVNNEILTFPTTCMDLEGIMFSEISQRKTNTIWYMWNIIMVQMNLSAKEKHTHREWACGCQSWGREWDGLGVWGW